MNTDQSTTTAAEDGEQTDRLLLQKIATDRDPVSMERLYLRFRPRVCGFLRRLTHDDGLIEESYHDVMLTVWNKAHQFKGQSKVSSWVFSIAYRVCLRMVRKQQFRDGVLDMIGKTKSAVGTLLEEQIEASDFIAQALTTLSAKHRLVVELSYYEGHTMEEIAEIAQCPVNTVKTRLHFARRKMREFVETAEQNVASAG